MKRKPLMPLKREEIERMSTKALLGRLKRLHQCEESLELSDLQVDSFDARGLICFKKTREWQTAYEDVKRVLSKREHIPRKSKLHKIKE